MSHDIRHYFSGIMVRPLYKQNHFMKTETIKAEKIYTQHEENNLWSNKLAFYKDEVKIQEKRLGEIASKNTSKDILSRVEQFQNKLIIIKNTMDILSHKINLSNDQIHKSINENEVAVDHRSIKDHSDLRDEVKMFDLNFTSLRSELNLFLVKWM